MQRWSEGSRRFIRLGTAALALFFLSGSTAVQSEPFKKNVIVYKEADRFAGWPANNGIWSWGDEIVVGFTLGYHDITKFSGHPINRNRPSPQRLARSLDGGETWTIEVPSYYNDEGEEPEPVDLEESIDFSNPDLALMFRMEHSNHGYSRFFYSYDRCHTWKGPYTLPTFDRKGIFARTDYIINGKHDLQAFLTAAEDEGGEGWPFCARTRDGGLSWEFQGWIGPQPDPRGGYAIMPSTLRLKNGALLSMIRRRGIFDEGKRWWVEAFLSPDDGKSWYHLDQPRISNKGNPAHMIRLQDGRIALTYGWRGDPYGIRAKISDDEGITWSEEIILRDDGREWDLGYPRTVQRADGKCVTAYYFNDNTGKERFIAATIWEPTVPESKEPE